MAHNSTSTRQVNADELRLRRLTIVDEAGEPRIELDAKAGGPASIYLMHPEPDVIPHGRSMLALTAGQDTEVLSDGRASVWLNEQTGEHHASFTFDIAEMRLRDARIEQLEKRLSDLETVLFAGACTLHGHLDRQELPLVEVECPRCGLKFRPEDLRAHLERCKVYEPEPAA